MASASGRLLRFRSRANKWLDAFDTSEWSLLAVSAKILLKYLWNLHHSLPFLFRRAVPSHVVTASTYDLHLYVELPEREYCIDPRRIRVPLIPSHVWRNASRSHL